MILIRKATPNDAEAIASHLFLAMEDIIYTFIGEEDSLKAKTFMVNFVKSNDNQYSYQNCWVADDNGTAVGAMNVYDGARLNELRQPVIDYVRKEYNNKDFNPEDETQNGEFYLDTIAVDPTQRGKGIGTKLLRFAIDEYVNRRKLTLGLLVDEVNLNAKRLYLRMGFQFIGKRVLFGKGMEHLQRADK